MTNTLRHKTCGTPVFKTGMADKFYCSTCGTYVSETVYDEDNQSVDKLLAHVKQLQIEYKEELAILKSEKAEAESLRKVRYAIALLGSAEHETTIYKMAGVVDRAAYFFGER